MSESSLSETQKILVSVPGLSSLAPEELNALSEYLRSESYPAGAVVFTEGEEGKNLYLIKTGSVEILRKGTGEFAATVRLARRGPGEIIGEMAVIGEQPRSTTAICVESSRLAVMSRESFLHLLQTWPELAQHMLYAIIAGIREADIQRLTEFEEKNRALEDSAARLHQAMGELDSANRQLTEALRFRQRLLDVSPFPTIVTNRELVVTYCNPAAATVFDIDGPTAPGRDISELLGWCSPEESEAITRALRQNGRWEGEAEIAAPGNRPVVCRIAAVPVPLDERPASIFLFVFHNETQIRLLQRQAAERERLASKSEMAAEIAHEINNYLAVLSGNVELLPLFLKSGNTERIDKCLKTLETSLGRMQVFSNALLSSRVPAQQRVLQNLNRYLENQVAFLRPQRKFKKVIIQTSFDETLPSIEFDPHGLQQTIYNLLLNSAEALASSGNPEPVVKITTSGNAQTGAVIVEIADNGPGIDPQILEQVFREQVTTKPGGHGVGMMTVKKIIDNHGGTVTAGNSAGGGAIFTIHLPAPVQVQESETVRVPVGHHP